MRLSWRGPISGRDSRELASVDVPILQADCPNSIYRVSQKREYKQRQTSNCLLPVCCKHESGPIKMQEDPFPGLSLLWCVHTHGDIAAGLARDPTSFSLQIANLVYKARFGICGGDNVTSIGARGALTQRHILIVGSPTRLPYITWIQKLVFKSRLFVLRFTVAHCS
jgi:hypothetical protein